MEERKMRLGFTVPQFGEDAGPDALLEVARLAEDLGYDSLWVIERKKYPPRFHRTRANRPHATKGARDMAR